MRRFSIIAVLTALLGMGLSAQNPPVRPNPQLLPPGTGSIDGIVVAMGTSQPVPGAAVELRKTDCNTFANPPEVFTTTTGNDGRFAFQNLRAGGWCVVAQMAGGRYTPGEYLQRGIKGRGATIPLADGQRITGVQLAMAPTGGIAGRVFDFDGEPLAFARVQVMESFYHHGERRLYILQAAQTNDLGEYRFYWLPPGRYYIAVAPEERRLRQVVSVQPPPGAGGHREDVMPPVVIPKIARNGTVTEEVYVTVYYPGETDPQRAMPIDLQPGSSLNGVDILLNAARTRSFHVRGSIVNGANGQPAAGAQVRVAPREWSATVIMPGAIADPNGNFDIAGVLPGSHVLYASLSMPNPAAPANPTPGTPPPPPIQLGARLPVEVGDTSVDNLRFVVVPGFSIGGRIVLEGGSANAVPRGINVSLVREPDIVGVPTPPARGAVQPDGTFSLQGAGPGDYRMYVQPFLSPFQWGPPAVPQQLQNAYLKSIRLGSLDILSDGLQLAGASPGEIEIVLGPGGRLSGQVTNEKREPLPNVTIALVPDLAFRERHDLYRTGATDTSGRFQIHGIPPGTYKAFAWEEVDRDAWENPDFMQPIEARGTRVDIREGNQTNTDLVAVR